MAMAMGIEIMATLLALMVCIIIGVYVVIVLILFFVDDSELKCFNNWIRGLFK